MKALFIVLCIICAIIPLIVYTVGIIKTVEMDVNCIAYLELAADANSVTLAEKHLTTAINYLEGNDLTHGNTSIIIKSPANDINIWYENLKSAQKQMQELSARNDLTELEESNALMKLRETLLDDTSVTHPTMISFFPAHIGWFWSMVTIWLLWILAFYFGFVAYDY